MFLYRQRRRWNNISCISFVLFTLAGALELLPGFRRCGTPQTGCNTPIQRSIPHKKETFLLAAAYILTLGQELVFFSIAQSTLKEWLLDMPLFLSLWETCHHYNMENVHEALFFLFLFKLTLKKPKNQKTKKFFLISDLYGSKLSWCRPITCLPAQKCW